MAGMGSSRHPAGLVGAFGGRFVDHAELKPHGLDAQPIPLRDGPVDDRAIPVLIHLPRGDAVIRGETSHQTDQESRSTGHRAGRSVTVITTSTKGDKA
jgi:hypothetical protein